MKRKRIMMDYGHLPVDQLPDDVKALVEQDSELQSWFAQNDWLQNMLDLKRAEAPAPSAEDRIQYRVEARLANASPEDLAVAARDDRKLFGFLFGRDSDTEPESRNPFGSLATPLTIAAGMVIGLTAVNYMVSPGGGVGPTPVLPVATPTGPNATTVNLDMHLPISNAVQRTGTTQPAVHRGGVR